MKTRFFGGPSLASSVRFGIDVIRHYGKGAKVLLVILFVVFWLVLTSLFGVFEKTSHLVDPDFFDWLGVVMVHIGFIVWALLTAVAMVPKTIAIFRRNRMRR